MSSTRTVRGASVISWDKFSTDAEIPSTRISISGPDGLRVSSVMIVVMRRVRRSPSKAVMKPIEGGLAAAEETELPQSRASQHSTVLHRVEVMPSDRHALVAGAGRPRRAVEQVLESQMYRDARVSDHQPVAAEQLTSAAKVSKATSTGQAIPR